MRVDAFDYFLPPERIAQRPLAERGAGRLLVVDRNLGALTHATFADLAAHLPPRALLILNDTAVIPARLIGRKEGTGGRTEIFLLERIGAEVDPLCVAAPGEPSWGRWKAMASASKKIREGTRLVFGEGDTAARATIVKAEPDGTWEIALEGPGPLAEGLVAIGQSPLPPYIRRENGPDAVDRARYQTVFATHPGAVAAPTAGLHFTDATLAALEAAGFALARVTLHVGAGTFLPVKVDDTDAHHMHRERYDIPEVTAQAIARARTEGRPVVAIGTTVLRTLETASRDGGLVHIGPGVTDIFITPGFRFRVIDALFTNFHMPRSTLVMLVSAFAGLDLVKKAYAEAIEAEYRFLSYGDAMLVK